MKFCGGYLNGKDVPDYVKKMDGYAFEVPGDSSEEIIIHHNYRKSKAWFDHKSQQWVNEEPTTEQLANKSVTLEDMYEFYEESKITIKK